MIRPCTSSDFEPIYTIINDAAQAYKGAEKSVRRTADGKLGFTNKRTEAYWRFREALNPEQPQGSPIALPDDGQLLADLTAPGYELTPNGIKLETKESVIDRLGRSTNRGDAVVMAWAAGPTYVTHGQQWASHAEHGIAGGPRYPKVVMGRAHARR